MANKQNFNFSGGINSHTSPLLIKDNEAEVVINYNLDKLGALTKRGGYEPFADKKAASQLEVAGLFLFNDVSAGTSYYIMSLEVFGNNNLYRLDAGVWTLKNSTGNPSEKVRFATFVDRVFRVHGTNDASVLGSLDAATWDATSAPPGTITPRCIAVFQDRLYVGGGGTTKSRLWFSSLPNVNNVLNGAIATGAGTITVNSTTGFATSGSIFIEGDIIDYTGVTATTFTGVTGVDTGHASSSKVYQYKGNTTQAITWDVGNDYVDINPDDNDEMTALENNGNRLLIFKKRALYRWTFGQVEPDRLIGVGTLSQESVKTNFDLGITFFANPKGVYAYTTGRPKLISRKIQEYIDSVTNWVNTYGAVDADHYYLFVGTIVLGGSKVRGATGNTTTGGYKTITNAMLVYHISLDAWTVYSLSNAITAMANVDGAATAGTEIIFGDAVRAYSFLVDGLPNDNNDGAQSTIHTEYVSKEYLLSYPNRTEVNWMDVFAQKRGAVNAFIDLDRRDDFMELGQLTERVTNLRLPKRECSTIRVKLAESTLATDTTGNAITSVIEGFNIEHTPKEKRDETVARIRKRGDNTYG